VAGRTAVVDPGTPRRPRARAGCSNCGARHCGTHRPAVTARRPEVVVTALLTSTRDGGLRFASSSNFLCAARRPADPPGRLRGRPTQPGHQPVQSGNLSRRGVRTL